MSKNIIWTDEQEELIRRATKWFNDPDAPQTFQYSGKAGTGKSEVMHAIIESIGLTETEYKAMAYTGAAALVMRRKGFVGAKTIHSSIYEPAYDKKNKRVIRFQWKYIDPHVRLICIDEASMVGERIKYDLLRQNRKILCCGDLNQLPPVKDQPAFLSENDDIFYLTKIMRQKEDSPIVQIADKVLNGIPVMPGNYGNTVLVIQKKDLWNNIYDIVKYYGIIICGKNVTRDEINDYVREKIYGYASPLPLKGEKLICRQNDWNQEVDGINLVNGLYGTASSTPTISVYEDDAFQMDFMPEFMDTPFINLMCDYKYFRADYHERRRMKEDFKEPRHLQKFEYAYAITTHVSQGSQFRTGVYMEEYLPRAGNKLNYTGITRFSDKCIYVLPDRVRKMWYNFAGPYMIDVVNKK